MRGIMGHYRNYMGITAIDNCKFWRITIGIMAKENRRQDHQKSQEML